MNIFEWITLIVLSFLIIANAVLIESFLIKSKVKVLLDWKKEHFV